jgi:hypothetical protein
MVGDASSPLSDVARERLRRWSAASEGVPAALRLSKSAQSADKVHFSDSTRAFARKLVVATILVTLTNDHDSS